MKSSNMFKYSAKKPDENVLEFRGKWHSKKNNTLLDLFKLVRHYCNQ